MKILKTSKLIQANSLNTAVMVVVNPEGKILILKRGLSAPWEPNRWNLPGGGIEDGESPLAAASRECQEEAGLTPSNIQSLGSYGGVDSFLGFSSGDSVSINFESSGSSWISIEELGSYDFVSPVPKILSEAFKYIGKTQ